jgi:uncharacterized protein (TIGR02611 family)
MATEPPPGSGEDLGRRLREAAVEAEYATGAREETVERAQRHILARLAIIAVGTVVLVAGLLMLVLPGPGIVGVLAGLGILAQELPWAERLMTRIKERTKVDQVRSQPAWVQIVMTLAAVAGIGATVVYFVTR